ADTGARFFPAWWRILNKATNPTPSRRYQSAKALIKDLKALRLKMNLASTGWMKVLKIVAGVIFILVTIRTITLYIRERAYVHEARTNALKQVEEIERNMLEMQKDLMKAEGFKK
ncbi:MAG: hypothetical protein IJC66_11610, partial [Kiritimatiellae bacterium]|nr:hypothetical protein [Kiritimatiellia bacterium]